MFASLKALLAEVIDYAGLFPPAKLALDQAIRNYARYRQDPDAWMLGRFICPAARLEELTPFMEEVSQPETPLRLSVLGRGGNSMKEFLHGLADDLQAILDFEDQWGDQAAIEVMEIRLPNELFQSPHLNDLKTVIEGPLATLADEGLEDVKTFFELETGPEWIARLGFLMGKLVEDKDRRFGYKLRTGGLQASAIPSVEEVAYVITICGMSGVPLKFTAGLHHPLRHFDAGLQAKMHGFLNLFVAGALAHLPNRDEQVIRQLIEEEKSGAIRFDDQGCEWEQHRVTTEQILASRQAVTTSFGSCSFDEPREDLRALGLLK